MGSPEKQSSEEERRRAEAEGQERARREREGRKDEAKFDRLENVESKLERSWDEQMESVKQAAIESAAVDTLAPAAMLAVETVKLGEEEHLPNSVAKAETFPDDVESLHREKEALQRARIESSIS